MHDGERTLAVRDTVKGFDDLSTEQNFFREFGPWSPWAFRNRLDDGHENKVKDYPGVYLLGFLLGRPVTSIRALSTSARARGSVADGTSFRRQRDVACVVTLVDSTTTEPSSVPTGENYTSLPSRSGSGADDLARSAEDWTQMFRLYVERRILWELTVDRRGTHLLLNQK